jgi:hypothetical protein
MSDQEQPQLETLTERNALSFCSGWSSAASGTWLMASRSSLPVNFTVLDGDIVFCMARGRKLSWLSLRGRLSFQADESRPADHEGWSVLVHGVAREVTDPGELAVLRRRPLRSWLRSPEEHWVRIGVESISGRALHRAAAGPPEPTRA